MTSKELVQIIEAELLKQGISKGEFYKACNISSGHMTNWRKEKNFPQTPTLVKISEYLGLDLLGAKTKKAPTPEGERESSFAAEVTQFLLTLPKDRLRGILLALGAPEALLSELDQQE